MGEADNYYNANQRGNDAGYYQQQQSGYNNGGNYQQPPMNYQQQPPPPPQQYQLSYPPPNGNGYTTAQGIDGEKYSFDQTFNIPKPKYNDLWAGILVSNDAPLKYLGIAQYD